MHEIKQTQQTADRAFTLIELLVAMAAAVLLTLCAGILLAGSQKNYNQVYGRVNGDATTDGYVARTTFDRICRKASLRNSFLSSDGQILEVYYYSSAAADVPDRYARFYRSGSDLMLDQGTLLPSTWSKDTAAPSRLLLASGIDQLRFCTDGAALQMFLSFPAISHAMPVFCSSIRHNE